VEKASLHESLLEAEHDESRLIDPEANSNIGGLYQFIPATELHGKNDWILESQHYQYYEENSEFPINILILESPLNIPPHLQVFTFDRGDFSPFPYPKSGVTKVSGKIHNDLFQQTTPIFLINFCDDYTNAFIQFDLFDNNTFKITFFYFIILFKNV